uniref:Uncharacterized protein n=1 Tax=viral metagenome TaxID=1070528 RepID=A0A6C0LER5_9ZZZZ
MTKKRRCPETLRLISIATSIYILKKVLKMRL